MRSAWHVLKNNLKELKVFVVQNHANSALKINRKKCRIYLQFHIQNNHLIDHLFYSKNNKNK